MDRRFLTRRGFALPWIVLTVAIIAAIAMAILPAVASSDDRKRSSSAAAILRQIAAGFQSFEAAVRSGPGAPTSNYPGQVSELSTVVNTTTGRNSCQRAMTVHDSTDWIAAGPFVSIFIPATGIWTPIGRVRDSVPARTNPAGTQAVFVELPGVSAEDAALLSAIVDNGTGDTISSVHAAVNDTTTLRYRVLSAGQVKNNRC